MTKEQAIDTIRKAAEKHGFITHTYQWTRLIEIQEPEGTHFLNFTVLENYAPDTDWSSHEVTMELRIQASLASMGGNPTAEELLKASEIIRRGAELVMELEGLSYTEKF